MQEGRPILVLGLGNTIRGDDGIGIYLARRLRAILPSGFEVREQETAGLDLIDAVAGFGRAVVIDAIETADGVPGQVHRLALEKSGGTFHLASMHGLGLGQTIELGKKLLGSDFPPVDVLAVEAHRLHAFSEDLSPELQEQFERILDTVHREIEAIAATPRESAGA